LGRVNPIRSQLQIVQLKEYLRARSERDYMLFVMGINIGVRIGDLIKLKTFHVESLHLTLIEEKRAKERVYLINTQLRKDIDEYIAKMSLGPNDYLFQSRKGENQHLSRSQAYRVFSDAGDALKIEKLGTHTLRKTFGYWHYRQFKDVAVLQTIFRHSSPSETLRYIGIEQDEIDASASAFYI